MRLGEKEMIAALPPALCVHPNGTTLANQRLGNRSIFVPARLSPPSSPSLCGAVT